MGASPADGPCIWYRSVSTSSCCHHCVLCEWQCPSILLQPIISNILGPLYSSVRTGRVSLSAFSEPCICVQNNAHCYGVNGERRKTGPCEGNSYTLTTNMRPRCKVSRHRFKLGLCPNKLFFKNFLELRAQSNCNFYSRPAVAYKEASAVPHLAM